MKKTFLLKTMLLLFALVVGVGKSWADGTLVSSLEGIEEGTYYIAALDNSKYYTVPSTTISGQTFTCTLGTYNSTSQVLTPAEGAGEFVFTPVSGVSNAFYIYNTNLKKYLVATGSKTFGYVDNASNDYGYWTFSSVSSGGFSGLFSVKHSNKSQYMRAYSTTVRCYDGTSNNGIYLFKKKESQAPSITAYDVTIDADANSGTIPYTVSNPIEGTNLSASTSTNWISDVIVGNDAVSFNASENVISEERTGTITLTYGTVTKDVTITQKAAVAKYTVTIETPENGTLVVKRGDNTLASGAQVPVGTVLTIEATPNEGYKFRNWQAFDGSTHTYTTSNTYTMTESNVTFTANFDARVFHNVNWNVNGTITTESYEESDVITFPTDIENFGGKEFMGWAAGEISGTVSSAPEYVSSATMGTNDLTYYAVFATKTSEGTTSTITLSSADIKAASDADASGRTSYKDRTIGEWSGKFSLPLANNVYSIQMNRNTTTTSSAYNTHLTTPLLSFPIKTVSVKTNRDTAKDRILYLCDKNDVGAAGEDDAVYGQGSSPAANGTIEINVIGSPKQVHIYPNGTIYIESVTLTYGSAAIYSDYCTTIAPVTITPNHAASTYVTTQALDFSSVEGLKAYVATAAAEGKITLEAVGAVPAGTPLLLKGTAGTEYTIPLAATATAPTVNMFEAGDGTTPIGGDSKYDFILWSDGLFYRADAGTLAVGKAYLHCESDPTVITTGGYAPALSLDFGEGTTGLSEVLRVNSEESIYYDLSGRRVAQPTKGLYIVNGKKVLVP